MHGILLGSLGAAAIAGYYFGSMHGIMVGIGVGVAFEMAFWLVAVLVLDRGRPRRSPGRGFLAGAL